MNKLLKYTVDLLIGKNKVESFATDDPKKLKERLEKKNILTDRMTLKITKN